MKINKFFFVLMVLLLLAVPKTLPAQEPLMFYVHPYLPAAELIKRFTPLTDYLSEKTGLDIKVNVTKDYSEHIKHIGEGIADIAYMGPASYVKMTDRYGKKPLLARLEIEGMPVFRGAIIVRKESPLKTLSGLKGKRFAFGDPSSTMSYLVPLYMLINEGVGNNELSEHKNLKSHNNVALSVLVGDFDAGAVKEEVFYKYEDRGLRVLEWTPEISEHLIIANDFLSLEVIEALRNALLQLKDAEDGSDIMRGIKETVTAMVPVQDGDYDNLRLILNTLQEKGVNP